MQIKATVRQMPLHNHWDERHPERQMIIADKDAETLELSHATDGEHKWCSSFGKHSQQFLKG